MVTRTEERLLPPPSLFVERGATAETERQRTHSIRSYHSCFGIILGFWGNSKGIKENSHALFARIPVSYFDITMRHVSAKTKHLHCYNAIN